MANLITVAYDEIAKTFSHPRRLRHVFDVGRWRNVLASAWRKRRIGNTWSDTDEGEPFRKRVYASYEDYLAHQKDKPGNLDLKDYDKLLRIGLRERLEKMDVDWSSKNVLCLAARLGSEVQSFLDVGAFAVGLDLSPGAVNKYVLYGDFHDLQFPDNSVDVVYTNSLDHVLEMERVLAEVRRVLRPDGRFIVEPVKGSDEGSTPQYWEAFSWRRIDDLVSQIEGCSFTLVQKVACLVPHDSVQLCFACQA